MKTLRRLLASFCAGLALAGCAGTNVAPSGYTNAADFRTCLLTVGKGELGSINEGAIKALEDGKKRLGVAVRTDTVKSADKIEEAINRDISANCSLIVGVGEAFVSQVMKQSKYHRSRHFALVLPPGSKVQASRDNVAVVSYDLSQAAYVAGFVAAGTSASGQVAAIAGAKNELNQALLSAFAQGVARYNAEQLGEDAKAVKANVNTFGSGLYLGDKVDDAQLTSQVETLVKQGSDVIFFAQGAQGAGGIKAIVKANQEKFKAAQEAAEAAKTAASSPSSSPENSASPSGGESSSAIPTESSIPVATPSVTNTISQSDALGTITAIWYLTNGHETQTKVAGSKPPILTSIVPDLSQAMISLIEDARKDKFATNSTQILGSYKNGWVGLSPFYEYDSTVPNEVKKMAKTIEEEFRQETLKL